MATPNFKDIFTEDILKKLFPWDRVNRFFDALYGDTTEGAYDISLRFKKHSQSKLHFEFHLNQRPGKCLACNLTYGLPQIFSRHPVININGLIQDINRLLNGQAKCTDWKLGVTHEVSGDLHVIPLTVFLEEGAGDNAYDKIL
jgi:hypothetical protein